MNKKIQEKKEGEFEGNNAESDRNGDSAKMGAVVSYQQGSKWFFDKTEWLTTAEAATYLRKVDLEGAPSVNAIHKLVSKGRIRKRKFQGRLFFKRKELAYLIESSGA